MVSLNATDIAIFRFEKRRVSLAGVRMRLPINISVAYFLATLAIALPALSFGQNNEHNEGQVAPGAPSVYYPYLLEGGVELTYPVTPLSFRKNFSGVYGTHASLSQKVYKGLYAGIEIQNSMATEQPSVPFPVATVATNMYAYNGALKLTYCSPENGEFLYSASITGGLSWIKFNSLPYGAPPSPPGEWYGRNVVFYTGRVAAGYKVNDQLCLSIDLAYTAYIYSFDPARIGVLQTYTPSQSAGAVTFFQWGFGVQYLFGKAR